MTDLFKAEDFDQLTVDGIHLTFDEKDQALIAAAANAKASPLISRLRQAEKREAILRTALEEIECCDREPGKNSAIASAALAEVEGEK